MTQKQNTIDLSQHERVGAYHVRNYKKDGEERSNWTQIGVAFRNKDGSFNVQLDSVPVDGRFNLRPFPERKQS